MTAYPKRLIEVDLPIKRISAHARREKSIRHGHISTLHIWWARRPLAACRAVICASLWPDPADPICPQSFRDAASQLIAAFAEKVFKTASLHGTVSPESFGQWEGIVKANEQGFAFDTHDSAHLNKLRFALLDFIADFAKWDNAGVSAYLLYYSGYL
jgi:putative DNA methylase